MGQKHLNKRFNLLNMFCEISLGFTHIEFMPLTEYRPKYGVKPQKLTDMFTKTYTIHLWRNLVTNKYKLDVNAKYDEKSLWEKIKKFIDN